MSSAPFYKLRSKYRGMDASFMDLTQQTVAIGHAPIRPTYESYNSCYRCQTRLSGENEVLAEWFVSLTEEQTYWKFFLQLRDGGNHG